ncbi:hypothetical protein B0O99DRAFT_632256 [Bisporella sp. PMI_857]|nr:hypothetical protein B0O99DRAFT_632256 [Bisporella sp. PMI_857]
MQLCTLGITMPPRIIWSATGLSRRPGFGRLGRPCLARCTAKSFGSTARIGLSQKGGKTSSMSSETLGHETNSFQEVVKTVTSSPKSRLQLRDSLAALQIDAGPFVNISQLNLALRGLDQTPGNETIRIAVLGLADHGDISFKKAKRMVRALLTDPLNEKEEDWERVLISDEGGTLPLLFKIGNNRADKAPQNPSLLQEFNVSSPVLNKNNLEILVLRAELPEQSASQHGTIFFENAVVPTLDIPTSSGGRYSPIRVPVHKSLLVTSGWAGMNKLTSHTTRTNRDIIEGVVDIESPPFDILSAQAPFQIVDIAKGDTSLQTFRNSVTKSWDQNNGWWESNLPSLSKWLAFGTAPTDSGIKEPVRKLIESVVENASSSIKTEHARQVSIALSAKITPQKVDNLRLALADWSEQAHSELRDQLDIAFHGHRWRKLGWWKLFWRVDDVSMITSDILQQRLLTEAEKEVIFLTGRFREAGAFNGSFRVKSSNWAWTKSSRAENIGEAGPPPPTFKELQGIPEDNIFKESEHKPWPIFIQHARSALALTSIPALQALAQRLVLQTLSTSSVFSALASLLYAQGSGTIYEVGAIAALGVVFSLRRMQGKWETARSFWEGEVREEGRKALRETEIALGETLARPDDPLEGAEELDIAQKAVQKAEAALRAYK